MNRRTQIRNLIAAQILDLDETLNVFKSKRSALVEVELPAIVVSIDSEQSERSSQSGLEVKKTALLSIEVIVNAGESGSDEVLDEITERVEKRLMKDESLADTVDHCTLKSTELALVREGELELGLAKMSYEITYYSNLTLDAPVDDFGGVNLYFSRKEKQNVDS